MSLIQIKYVGKKPHAFDNVARSGKAWNGAGDVQEVTDAQAKVLLQYPDQWALANPEDAAAVAKPTSVTGKDATGADVVVDPDALKKPLEQLTKPELVAFAKDRFGKDLDPKLGKKAMVDQIEEWQTSGTQSAVGMGG